MTTEFINRPVFVCGHPKAGTSLVTALLDGHPAIVAYPEETLFFRRFLPAIKGKTHAEKVALAERLLIHIFEWNQKAPPEHQQGYPDRDYADIDFTAVRDVMHSLLTEPDAPPSAYLNAAILAFGRVTGLLTDRSAHWVEKTPYNESYAAQIFDWWPEARCIHVVRDPRDNFVSYQRKQPDWTSKVFALNWARSTHAGLENRDRYGEGRYMLVRFEDLLCESEQVTRQMAEFLGLSWEPGLLQPTRVGDSWRGNSMFARKYHAISTDPIGRWKDLISPFDLAIIQAIAGELMHRLDYPMADVDLSDLSLAQRMRVWREKLVRRP